MENNRPLGWTTLEEAKRLVKAGLDQNTADMWISPNGKYIGDSKQTPNYNTYPCWSIGNLFNIAYTIVENDWFCLEKDVKKHYITDYIITSIYSTIFKYDTLMETCVYFVTELLKRRNILKK